MLRVLLVSALAFTGCAGLIVDPDDGIPMKTTKVSTRVVLGLATLGVSELSIEETKRQQAHDRYVFELRLQIAQCLSRALEASDERMQRWWLSQHDIAANELRDYLARVDGDQRARAAMAAAILSNRAQQQPAVFGGNRTSCTSRIVGNTVYTDCY